MTRPIPRILLAVSALIGLAVGLAVVFQPHAFFTSTGIILGTDPDLMSEIRAPGGVLVLASLFIAGGAVRVRLMPAALWLSALLYGGYGLARLVSMVFDGMPSQTLIYVTGLELIIGAASLLLALRQAPHTSKEYSHA